jgi:fructose-1,6-bisphosphatase/inositol monophosphatase family enzyme
LIVTFRVAFSVGGVVAGVVAFVVAGVVAFVVVGGISYGVASVAAGGLEGSFKEGRRSWLTVACGVALVAAYAFLVWFCFLGGWRVFPQ